MTPEIYCAHVLSLAEAEIFLAVGDAVGRRLNDRYEENRQAGQAVSLPDLLSFKREAGGKVFRLREVKFKLDERSVRKAISQLKAGAEKVCEKYGARALDRLEIVIPLRGRKLKEVEKKLLGPSLGESRFQLRLGEVEGQIELERTRYPVTVLIL